MSQNELLKSIMCTCKINQCLTVGIVYSFILYNDFKYEMTVQDCSGRSKAARIGLILYAKQLFNRYNDIFIYNLL